MNNEKILDSNGKTIREEDLLFEFDAGLYKVERKGGVLVATAGLYSDIQHSTPITDKFINDNLLYIVARPENQEQYNNLIKIFYVEKEIMDENAAIGICKERLANHLSTYTSNYEIKIEDDIPEDEQKRIAMLKYKSIELEEAGLYKCYNDHYSNRVNLKSYLDSLKIYADGLCACNYIKD